MTGRPPAVAVLVPVVAAAFLGCSGESNPGAAPRNYAGTPLEALPLEAIPEEALHVVGTPHQIAAIKDLAIGEDGVVWLLNSVEPFFVAVEEDGTIRHEWGREGDGPGEFDSPSTLLRGGSPSRVWTYDPYRRRLTRIDGPGDDPIEEVSLPLSTDPYGRVVRLSDYVDSRHWITGYGDGFLFAHEQIRYGWTMRKWNFDVGHLAMDQSLRPVASSATWIGDPPASYGDVERQRFPPLPLWAACLDGSMALYDPLTNSVKRLTPSGEETRSHALPSERRVEVTMDRLWALIYPRLKAQRDEVARSSPSSPQAPFDSAAQYESAKKSFPDWGFADVLPEYRSLSCGGRDGEFWLQLFDAQGGGRASGEGPRWLRIGRDGSMRRVDFPAAFRPLRFTADRVWGSRFGEFDEESVAWVEMPE